MNILKAEFIELMKVDLVSSRVKCYLNCIVTRMIVRFPCQLVVDKRSLYMSCCTQVRIHNKNSFIFKCITDVKQPVEACIPVTNTQTKQHFLAVKTFYCPAAQSEGFTEYIR